MTINYVLHTGETVDADGNTLWIDGDQLARLYGVPMSQCLILNPAEADELQVMMVEVQSIMYILEDGKYPQCF